MVDPAKAPPAPPRFLDIVMKGGITSGVVYPLAAAELAEVFRFRSIGGTSAGAIAAAATAAAEHGRLTGRGSAFAGLADFIEGDDAFVLELLYFVQNIGGFFKVRHGLVEPQWFSTTLCGPEIFSKTRLIVAYQRVCSI